MRCAACGYERNVVSETVTEAMLYKSGKKKGEVKEIAERTVTVETGPDFKMLRAFVEKSDQEVEFVSNFSRYEEPLYVCPRCGTVRIAYPEMGE